MIFYCVALAVPAIDMEVDQAKAIFDINLFGVMRMVREFSGLILVSHNIAICYGGL